MTAFSFSFLILPIAAAAYSLLYIIFDGGPAAVVFSLLAKLLGK